jgi:hypothetical protein
MPEAKWVHSIHRAVAVTADQARARGHAAVATPTVGDGPVLRGQHVGGGRRVMPAMPML